MSRTIPLSNRRRLKADLVRTVKCDAHDRLVLALFKLASLSHPLNNRGHQDVVVRDIVTHPDFLDKFIEAKSTHPDIVDDGQVISYLMINMITGADTTAITIRSVLYYSIRNPQVWNRLQREIGAVKDVVAFKDARALPYLDACVREAMRMHPPVGMIMERFVPPQGLELPDGTKVPPGVAVGLNPYIINRNTSVYGQDVETFRAERWLQEDGESEEGFSARLANMNACDLTFGAGSRICIGKHLGLVETFKVVATLVARYNIELVHSLRDWHVTNSWFMRQEGIEVRLSKRK